MQERHTNDSVSLLLRSPTASQGEGGALGEEEARKRGNTVGIRDQAMDIAKANLLPTTRANEPGSTSPGYGDSLNDIANRVVHGAARKDLLPTPNTMEHREIKTSEQIAQLKQRSPGGYRNLREEVVNTTNWGKFEPAIRRWESVLGRPAPSPTKPDGRDGAHRLSSAFTEWMMGVPEGWITDCGLKRNEELKACGNGVVPQQAELALRILLDGFVLETAGGGSSESANSDS